MNLGDKIKKYRVLRGLTQTKLGEMVGFSRTTANSRIRKYETNEMAPKADIRQKIADALDVDMSSLSDIDINTEEDVLHSLFLLEEEYGMEINKEGDKINLSFSLSDNNNQKLMGYLCNWASIKNSTADDKDSLAQYENWKARFPMDINSYLKQQLDELNEIYEPLIRERSHKAKKIKDMSVFMKLIRDMMENGIQIKAEHKSWQAFGDGGMILHFKASQITDKDNKKAIDTFADFLCGIGTISGQLQQPFEPNAFITSDGTAISYALRNSSFSGMQRYINEVQKLIDNGIITDWEKKNYESYFHLLEDEWKMIRFD